MATNMAPEAHLVVYEVYSNSGCVFDAAFMWGPANTLPTALMSSPSPLVLLEPTRPMSLCLPRLETAALVALLSQTCEKGKRDMGGVELG